MSSLTFVEYSQRVESEGFFGKKTEFITGYGNDKVNQAHKMIVTAESEKSLKIFDFTYDIQWDEWALSAYYKIIFSIYNVKRYKVNFEDKISTVNLKIYNY